MSTSSIVSTPRPEIGHATESLSRFASELSFDDLPAHVRRQGIRLTVDTLACIVGAGPYEGSQITDRVISSLGGTPEARALPSGHLTSAPNAAYINAELANALDLDDNLLNHTHFANTSVAGPLAMAERLDASGQDLITAVVAAYEVSARMTLSFPNVVELVGEWPDVKENFRDLHGMGFSVFGVAGGCGNLAGLSTNQMMNAFGAAGYHAPVPTVSKATINPTLRMKKYAAYGQIAWSSIVAVFLAEQGYTADQSVLDGPRGFWRMTGADDCDWKTLLGGLGSTWWCLETSFKLVPICTWNRQPLRALTSLLDEHRLQADEIEEVEVFVHPASIQQDPWLITDPSDYLSTQLSHPWAVAMTVLGIPPNRWQHEETIADPRTREFARRVRLAEDPDAHRAYWEQTNPAAPAPRRVRRSPSTVRIYARGTVFSASSDLADGDPFSPDTEATDEQLREKLLHFGSLSLPDEQLEKAADLLFDLENVANVRDLTDLLSIPGRARRTQKAN